MSDRKYLESKGWRLAATKQGKYAINYWEHPDHQPTRHGYFTTSDARWHQRMLDKGNRCTCIKGETNGT